MEAPWPGGCQFPSPRHGCSASLLLQGALEVTSENCVHVPRVGFITQTCPQSSLIKTSVLVGFHRGPLFLILTLSLSFLPLGHGFRHPSTEPYGDLDGFLYCLFLLHGSSSSDNTGHNLFICLSAHQGIPFNYVILFIHVCVCV